MKIFFPLLIISFFLNSCSQVVEIDLPPFEEKPVVNCLFSAGEPFRVQVGLPAKPTDTIYSKINNVNVTIIHEQQSYFLSHQEDGFYASDDLIAGAGETYSLKVQVPGYPEVTATDSIPKAGLKFISYKTKTAVGYEEEMDVPYSEINISLQSERPGGYYGIDEEYGEDPKPVTSPDGYSVWIYAIFSDDPVMLDEEANSYDANLLLFNDRLFKEGKHILSVNFYSYPERFRIFNFSRAAYEYLHTWFIHDYTKEYDFWEAYESIPMYGNVKNGYGIFAGYSSRDYEIKPDTTETFEQ